jgi:glycosyltransferase involved in cell wall biosynthesis
VIVARGEQLLPVAVPGLDPLCNRYLARCPGMHVLGMTIFIVARPRQVFARPADVGLSVVVPVRNEAGNIAPALARIPLLGRATEVIFVEGHSRDDTWETLQREVAAYTGPLQIKISRQPGKGKWDAVRHGFAQATQDVLVIQDGDLTAPPEDLPKFFAALCAGTAEFANGSRLVYPMEDKAMRFLNMLGNHFFAVALTFVLGQRIKDSLCGTKMMARRDYERLLRRLPELGDFDPFGDFNLLFGSALLGLRIRDIPVRYQNRAYGDTNISRFRHGWLLLKMTLFGLRKVRCR